MDASNRSDAERNHAGQFIEWIERAIYAVEKADYAACRIAMGVARKHLDQAENNAKTAD